MGILVVEQKDFDQLLEKIKELRREVDQLKQTSVQWLTTDQACQQLQCGREKLDTLRKTGKIEFRKNGATYRYLASSIADCYEETAKAKAGRGKKFPKLADPSFKRLAL
jgi:hypothetical protein